jgi:hypothetical protein
MATVKIHPNANVIEIDSVSFSLKFGEAQIHGGHPQGPVFVCGAARAVISATDAAALVKAGVTDKR